DSSEDPITHNFGAEAGTAEYQCNYAVHYADVEYAVQPITEGYRIALVYSVCWPADSTQPAPSLSGDSQAPMFKALAELADANRDFHYYFEHVYTPKSIRDLGVGCLNGQDRARVDKLCVLNAMLPPHQRFTFYLVEGVRRAHYYRFDYKVNHADWKQLSPPSYRFLPLLSLEGKYVAVESVDIENNDVLNPDGKTRMQRWRGHRVTTFEEDHSSDDLDKDTTFEKYLLLAWPAKLTEDKMFVLTGVEAHFTGMLSAGVDPDAVREFVQRVTRVNAIGLLKAEREIKFGQALYQHIISEPQLYDLFPIYFDIFPRGTHGPEYPTRLSYGESPVSTTPFIDIIQMTQQPRYWETLEGKVIEAFAGKVLPILDFMEEVGKSKVLKTEMKDQLTKKLLALFRQPNVLTSDANARKNEKLLQPKLWSAVLANEGSEFVGNLARTYVALFPQGAYATTQPEGNQRFEDLLHLATSVSAWDSISPTILDAFEGDLYGTLIFIRMCIERSLRRTVWAPFVDIAVKFCEAPGSLMQTTSHSSTTTPRPLLLKELWDTAILIDSKAEDGESVSDAAVKLLTRYITEAPIGLAAAIAQDFEHGVEEDFDDLIHLAHKFPSVWEASKSKVLSMMRGADLKRSLVFVQQCRLANLPEAVWAPSVELCLKTGGIPTYDELTDERFQAALWGVAVDLPNLTLCQLSVKRYLVLPLLFAEIARSALIAACKANSQDFKSKCHLLEPLLRDWSHPVRRDFHELQRKFTEANSWSTATATITGHPSLATFAESTETSTRIGGFDSLAAARKCAQSIYFKNCKGTAEAGGRGKDAYVLVTKDLDYVKQLESEYQRAKQQYDDLRDLLSQSEAEKVGPAVKKRRAK
ncbi:unnamed protein product, partial [Tilletia controversa]